MEMALPPIIGNYGVGVIDGENEPSEEKSDILFDDDDSSQRLKEFVDALSRFVVFWVRVLIYFSFFLFQKGSWALFLDSRTE